MSTIENINIGDQALLEREVKESDIVSFAEVSGDFNPAHMNEEYAKTTVFGKRIAHGMLSASFISNVIANQLPGSGTIYLEQSLKFLKPVYIGDNITVSVTAIEKNEEKNRLKLETVVSNQYGDKVIVGVAIVMPPKN